jgi:hypothetical protein
LHIFRVVATLLLVTDLNALTGDKVKLKRSADIAPGAHGVISEVAGSILLVLLEESGQIIRVPSEKVTNFSLAARKAWQNMPARNVGRPKGSRVCDRLSVTIRVDRDLWERFRSAEASGAVADRTTTLNRWIAEGLDGLTAPPRRKAS